MRTAAAPDMAIDWDTWANKVWMNRKPSSEVSFIVSGARVATPRKCNFLPTTRLFLLLIACVLKNHFNKLLAKDEHDSNAEFDTTIAGPWMTRCERMRGMHI